LTGNPWGKKKRGDGSRKNWSRNIWPSGEGENNGSGLRVIRLNVVILPIGCTNLKKLRKPRRLRKGLGQCKVHMGKNTNERGEEGSNLFKKKTVWGKTVRRILNMPRYAILKEEEVKLGQIRTKHYKAESGCRELGYDKVSPKS